MCNHIPQRIWRKWTHRIWVFFVFSINKYFIYCKIICLNCSSQFFSFFSLRSIFRMSIKYVAKIIRGRIGLDRFHSWKETDSISGAKSCVSYVSIWLCYLCMKLSWLAKQNKASTVVMIVLWNVLQRYQKGMEMSLTGLARKINTAK